MFLNSYGLGVLELKKTRSDNKLFRLKLKSYGFGVGFGVGRGVLNKIYITINLLFKFLSFF
jgi:hypothetical protein